MLDLYKILGLSRDATPADVQRAYRKASKKAHPDMPEGSPEKFSLVKLAKDVLGDERRRASYDQTGSVEPPEPDNTEAAARNAAFGAIAYVVEQIDARGASYREFDIVGDAKRRLQEQKRQIEANLSKSRFNTAHVEDLVKRFKPKKGKADFITPMLNARLAAMRQDTARIEQNLKEAERAIELLGDVEFDGRPKASSVDPRWAGLDVGAHGLFFNTGPRP